MFSKAATVALGAQSAMGSNSTAGSIHLSALNIEKGSVTVSGLSSGAYMAVQMHVAYSSLFNGVGVFAGGPFYCAQGSLAIAEEQCMYDLMGGPQVNTLISYTKNQATLHTIDSTDNMADDKVYVFSGSKDTTVYPKVVKTLEDYYGAFVTAKLTTEYTVPAQHCMPTTNTNYGEECGTKKSPYIGKCNYDGAEQALQLFYGSLASGKTIDSNLYQFDQTEFFTGSSTSINDFGYIYIPTACKDGSKACRLHMSFHGCLQDYASIGSDWAVHTGYNSWAEANNIIVVYPYVKADAKLGNGNACWDWWGYTGADYVLKSGVQMTFAKDVLDAIIGDSFDGDNDDDDTDDTLVQDDTPSQDDTSVIVEDDDSALMTLKPHNIDSSAVTVSGLSSGAYMAVQMHVAYSSLFNGVGVFAGGPFYCAKGSLTIAEEQCMYGLMGGPQVDSLISYTKNQASLHTIDSTDNMAGDKVYVFSGSKDTTVYPKVVKTLEDYYGAFVTAKLTTEYTVPAQHCMPTTNTNYGEECGTKKSPYIGKCNYDGAEQALQLFYGSLASGTSLESNLHKFDQTEFFTGSSTSINDFGYIYIPTACKDGSKACRLHMSFHGCLQDYADIGSDWAVHAGYNSWAEANNIIVVYPYVKADAKLGNGNACWDWWGYTGADYVLKSGVQMTFAKDVLNRLMGV